MNLIENRNELILSKEVSILSVRSANLKEILS